MMQNGFRRIALAQGLLPARPPSPAVSARDTTSDIQQSDLGETERTPTNGWNSDPEMRVASIA
jgi:hypothetical protein